MRISDWSSDVCSSDLIAVELAYFAIGIAIAAKEAKTERQLCVEVEVEALNFDLVDAHCGLEADRREEFELLRALDVSFEQCAIDCEKAIEQPQFRANFPGCGYFLVEAIQHIDRTGWKSQASGGGDQRFTRSDWIEAAGFEPLAIAGIDRCLARELVDRKSTRLNSSH